METAAIAEVEAFVAQVTARQSAAAPGGVVNSFWVDVDALPAFQRIALRSTFTYLTGVSPYEAGVSTRLEDAYLAASSTLRAALPARSRSIWAVVPDWAYRHLTPLGRSEARATRAAHVVARIAVAAARPDSPLAAIMTQHRGSLDDLHAAATLLFAGHDTQGATLAWCALCLGHDVEWQAKLRAAMRARGSEDIADAMLDATIKETLRLHPPAPLVVRALHGSYAAPTVPASASPASFADQKQQLAMPAGGAAAIWLYAVHRDGACWGSDADEFVPGRWLPSSGSRNPPGGEAAYMPFAAGARTCPGAALATAALRRSVAVLVSHLEWTLLDADSGGDGDSSAFLRRVLHPSVGFTVNPAHGVNIRVRPVT